MKLLKKLFSKFFGLKIKNCGNNILQISNSAYFRKTKIKIYGNNNFVSIKDNAYLHNTYIRIGFPDCPVKNTTLRIGEKTSFNGCDIQIGEDNSSIVIGSDCMFSFDTELTCTDTHSIFNYDGEIINIGQNITVGNNCWIGRRAKILKNTIIPDNCIVAQDSVLTKKFEDNNSIFAGNPAKLVKTNINWSRLRPNEILRKREKNNA